MEFSSVAQMLNKVLPGTGETPLEQMGQGDFCLAFRYGEQVVRVARHAEAAAALRRETCVLARIAERLSLPVPRLAFFAPPDCPPFTVHRAVNGVALTRELWEDLPAAARDHTAAGLAEFLLVLHALPVEIGQECGLEGFSAFALAEEMRETVRETIWGRLDVGDQRRWAAFLMGAVHQLDHSRPPALIHCDIAPGHVLFEPASGALTGIIDFGDLAIGSPARDFIYIYEDFGPDMLNAVLDRYAGSAAGDLLRETRQWYLLEAAAWTVEMHNAGHASKVEHGLAEMRRELAWITGG